MESSSEWSHVAESNVFNHERDFRLNWMTQKFCYQLIAGDNPNLKVVVMHAMHVCSQHLFGLPLRMYGMHRTQFDHESPPSTPHDLITCVLAICHVKHGETYAKHSNGAKSLLDLRSLSPALSNFWLLLVMTITKSVIF